MTRINNTVGQLRDSLIWIFLPIHQFEITEIIRTMSRLRRCYSFVIYQENQESLRIRNLITYQYIPALSDFFILG